MSESAKVESVQTFGRKVSLLLSRYVVHCLIVVFVQKTATAVAFVKKGTGLIKVNGSPMGLLQPEILKLKIYEPILLLGTSKFANVRP